MGSEMCIRDRVGVAFAACDGRGSVSGQNLKELVEIVRSAHGHGVIHRDIKPQNVYLSGETMLLNDWSSAVKKNRDSLSWEGTYGFSVSTAEREFRSLSAEARDLVSVVRTAYVLLFRVAMPPSDDQQAAIQYWRQTIRDGTVWAQALSFAKAGDYEQLGNLLCTLT